MIQNSSQFAVRGGRAMRLSISLLCLAAATSVGAAEPGAGQAGQAQAAAAAKRSAPRLLDDCVAEKRCAPGYESDTCMTDFGKPDACKQKHAKDGFVFACKTHNMSRWNEVYCRPGTSGAAATQDKAK